MSDPTIPPTSSDLYVRCEQCSQPRYFKGSRGLKIHESRVHRQDSLNTTSLPHPNVVPPSVSYDDVPLWKRLSSLKCNRPLVKRIPRGARISVARALSQCISQVVKFNNLSSWDQLLTFAYRTLYAGRRHVNEGSLSQLIKDNCTNSDPLPHLPFPTNSSNRNSSSNNIKGAAHLLFSNDVFAPDNPETLSALLSKHPLPSPTLRLPDPPLQSDPSLIVTSNDIQAALFSFKKGSAGGLDGLTPQHLKDLVSSDAGDAASSLLANLTSLVNLMLSGRVDERIIDILYGANLIALKKKDGGIRPIAIGRANS
ncbi:hypothetical protein ABMA28_016516 [Loxostege sticticalis]|uniref:Reverse transcriptase n=1 Tax=Loxostege sticticalis TaxID=481309 RepID=A0ABD0TC47_LOXSC